jgi:xylose isomerase
MYEVLKAGGFTNGGLNFDAKTRRASNTIDDILLSYIAGMDAFALGLKKAAAIIQDGRIDKFIKDKYSSYKSAIGKKIDSGKTSLDELYKYGKDIPYNNVEVPSGSQEYLEEIVNNILFSDK